MPNEKDEKPQASRRGFFGTIAAAFGGGVAATALPASPPQAAKVAPLVVTHNPRVFDTLPKSCGAFSAVMMSRPSTWGDLSEFRKIRTEPE